MNEDKVLNDLGYRVRGCIFNVYNELGPGLLESIYESALMIELEINGLHASRQVPVSVEYKGHDLGEGLRIDILVENSIILELKSVENLQPVHYKQLLSYLKIAKKHLGYLVNFNSANIRENIIRKVDVATPQITRRFSHRSLRLHGFNLRDNRIREICAICER